MDLSSLSLGIGRSMVGIAPKLSLDFANMVTLDPRITFTRASSATYFDRSGVLQVAANDTPRLDYNPLTGVSLGLLIEEQRTNLLLNTEALSTQSIDVSAVAHTLSFYGTGQVVLSGAASATVTGSAAYPTRTSLTFTPSAATLTLTVTGSVQYAQLEAGGFATSYIPTLAASVTREADNASMSGTNLSSWYNASANSLCIEFERLYYGDFVGYPRLLSLNDGTTSNAMDLVALSGTTAIFPTMTTAGAGQLDFTFAVPTALSKMAYAFKQDDTGIFYNGVSILNDTSCIIPSVTQLDIGSFVASSHMSVRIRRISSYPRRMSNADLIAITS